MRNAFASHITELVETDRRIVLLSGDIGNRLFDDFKKVAPDNFYNCGVAEANMMSMAAGLALNGLRPVVYTIAPFVTVRCLEQIRVGVCYHGASVVIVGTGAGLCYAQLGPTHHSLEDVAILRSIPEMTVFCPVDSMEMRAGLREALQHDGPVYIRLGKKGEPDLHGQEPRVRLGEAITLRDGSDACLIATGPIMDAALRAADIMAEAGKNVRVECFHTVKPLDEQRLMDLTRRYPLIGVVEEHSAIGGLFGAISEWVAVQGQTQTRLISFSTADAFIHRVGTQEQARERAGLTAENIANRMRDGL